MQVLIDMKKKTLIAKMMGELDHHNAEQIRKKLDEEIINRSAKNLILDFRELAFMDSSGIGMIIGRYKLISALGGQVNVVCDNKQIERLIAMSGLKKILNIYYNYEDAIESL